MGQASGVIGNLTSALNCSQNCACCQTLEQQINGLSSELQSLRNQIGAIDSKQQSFEQWVRSELSKLTDTIGSIAASIDRKIDAILSQVLQSIADLRNFVLSLLSGRDSTLEGRLNGLEDRLNKHGLRLQDFTAQLNALAARVGNLESWRSGIERKLGDLDGAIRSCQGRLSSVESQIQELRNRIDELKRYIDSKIGELSSTIDRLIKELKEQIESFKRFVSERITNLERKIDNLIETFKSEIRAIREFVQSEVSKLFEFIRSQIKALTDLIYSLLGGKKPDQDYKYLEKRIGILEGMVDSLNRRFSGLESLVQRSSQRVDYLFEQVADILQRLKNLSNNGINMSEIRGLFQQLSNKIDNLARTDNSSNSSSKIDTILNFSARNIQDTNKVLNKLSVNISGETVLSDCKNGDNNIIQPYSGTGLNAISSQLTSLSLALSSKLCNLQTNEDPTEQQQRDKTLNRIYKILGGDAWVDSGENIRIYHDPEKQIRTSGKNQYNDKGETSKNTESKSLIDWIQNMLAPQYYRAGYQELPGEVPETLLSIGSDKDRKILNALDLQQWFIEQLDALIGQFPLEIEIKDSDPLKPGDQPKKLELANLSEVLAELVGLNFLQTQNSDILINYVNRLGVETIATKNAAIIAQDYAKANALYLGYNANPVKREVTYALNPAGESLETILSETKGDLIGWANTDKNSVNDYLRRIFFTVGILKESNFIRPKNVDRLIDSLGMVRTQEQAEASAKLTNDIEVINDPNSTFNSPRQEDPSLPQVQVKIKKKR